MNKLKEIRRARKMPQQALAVLAGVSPSLLVMIERWSYHPSEPTCRRLAAALDVLPSDIWPELIADGTDPAVHR